MLLPFSGGVDALLLLIIAMILDACIGDARWLARLLPAPATLFATITARLDRRLNRIDRTDSTRRLRGALTALGLVALAILLGLALSFVARSVRFGAVLELLVLFRAVTLRLPWAVMGRTLGALEAGNLEAARDAVAPLTDRQCWSLDHYGVVRAAVEGMALRFACGLVAPAFWYALFGLAGLLGWAAIDGVARIIGHDVPRFRYFGAVARQLQRIAGFPAMLLAVLALLLAASFVPHGKALAGVRGVKAARRHPWGTMALPVAAVAGILDLALGGPRREGEMVVKEPWIGDGRARALARDLRVAMALYIVAALIMACLVMGAGVAVHYQLWT